MRAVLFYFLLFITSSVSANQSSYELMSFNIRYGHANDGIHHWDKRKTLVVQAVKREAPDILGLQEALLFQIEYILKSMPEYSSLGEARDGGDKGEYSAILYQKNKFSIEESGTFWLSDTPETPSSHWGNRYLRICTWAHFKNLENGEAFYVFNTHLDHESKKARERSADLIKSRILNRKDKAPFILMGDFNADEQSLTIQNLLVSNNTIGMRDSYRQTNTDTKLVGTFNGFKGTKTGRKIDYIFTSPLIKVLNSAIIYEDAAGKYPSDHYPVTATISLTKSAKIEPSAKPTL